MHGPSPQGCLSPSNLQDMCCVYAAKDVFCFCLSQAALDLPDLPDRSDQVALLGPLAVVDNQAKEVQVDNVERLDLQDAPDQLDRLALLDHQELLVLLDLVANVEKVDHWDLLEAQEVVENVDLLDPVGLLDLQVQLDQLEEQENKVPVVRVASLALLVV